jgi:uncharacterized protein involved in exopolysaccharide biosynthesis
MTTAVITAMAGIIGAIISGIVALLVASKQYNKTVALIEYRMNALEKKVEKHNDLQNRVLELEMNEKAQWRWIDEFKEERDK